jgi:hypothetical protein
MISKRTSVQVILALFVLVGAYLVFGSSEERKVLGVLRELAAALSTQRGDTRATRERRIATALAKHLNRPFLMISPETGAVDDVQTATELAAATADIGFEVAIKESDVRLAPGNRARASLLVEVVFRPMGEERRERRDVTVELSRRDDDYRIERVEVSGASKEEPEARP